MQLLGNLFEYELARRGATLNILGATSGDTGSAAEYAMRGKRGIARLHAVAARPDEPVPAGADVQPAGRRTSTTSRSKACSTTARTSSRRCPTTSTSRRAHTIGTVNSINWARVWRRSSTTSRGYFAGDARRNDEQVDFAVPSGNFGNICAGHVARMMGLPIRQLVLATNENDVLDEFFRTGVYRVRAAAETHETSSPSMDISKASNFERFVFDLRRPRRRARRALFATSVETRRRLRPARRAGERGAIAALRLRLGHAARMPTAWRRSATCTRRFGMMIDTAHRRRPEGRRASTCEPGVPMIVLETALAGQVRRDHPRSARPRRAARPPRLRGHRGAAAALRGDAGRRRAG